MIPVKSRSLALTGSLNVRDSTPVSKSRENISRVGLVSSVMKFVTMSAEVLAVGMFVRLTRSETNPVSRLM